MTDEEGPGRALRIVVADDEPLYRAGLAALLESAGHVVCAQAGEAAGLLGAVARTVPDLAVVDIRMPPTRRLEGLEAAVRIRRTHPGVGILLLSKYIEMTHLQQLLRAGSGPGTGGVGYLLKERVARDGFLDDVRRVAAGDFALDGEIQRALHSSRRKRERVEGLTEQELTVLRLMAQGLTNPGIARKLGITVRTVEDHVGSIFRGLSLPGEAESQYHRRVVAVLTYLQS
ncbi:two component transcriptional regulator, LuxR family [Actinobacteria bacterium OK074]|nr:two component transcriptional regulator, LuxR family [Actinobacteria bacterium OK074]